MLLQPNGKLWTDTDGKDMQAHGGHMLFADGMYYLYGENRLDNAYVSCYRSRDLVNWEFRGNVLTADSKTEAIRTRTELRLKRGDGGKVNIERPKVLYCEKTGKYMMWAHYENGVNYRDARICIASCDTPDGDFTYHGSFNPYGNMSRDCTLFKDDDGAVYWLCASRDNADLHIYLLSDDMLNVRKHVNTLFQGEFREAPAMFKKDGRYYLLSSYCTGWAPNQGKWAVGDTIDGLFSELEDFGDETTFGSQPTFVWPVDVHGRTEFVYVGDRWNYHYYADGEEHLSPPEHMKAYYCKSSFVILPIRFDGERPYIEYAEAFDTDAFDR